MRSSDFSLQVSLLEYLIQSQCLGWGISIKPTVSPSQCNVWIVNVNFNWIIIIIIIMTFTKSAMVYCWRVGKTFFHINVFIIFMWKKDTGKICRDAELQTYIKLQCCLGVFFLCCFYCFWYKTLSIFIPFQNRGGHQSQSQLSTGTPGQFPSPSQSHI